MRAPRLAKARAVARPTPPDAPVMATTSLALFGIALVGMTVLPLK
jgi:hypothetical protein